MPPPTFSAGRTRPHRARRPRALRWRVAGAVVATLVAGGLLAVPAGAAPSAAPPFDPSRLAHVGTAHEVVVVTATNWSTSHATLRAYRKWSGSWHRVLGPISARIGWNGFSGLDGRLQNSGETPSGTFRLLRAFGPGRDPGARLYWHRFDRNDWWPYDPRDARTYNLMQQQGRSAATRWRTSWAEHLWSYRQQYRYAVVLDYNLPAGDIRSGRQRFARQPSDTRAGGGIFLHVTNHRPTAGCVAVSRSAMLRLVRWLDPRRHPVIVMAPERAITRA